MLNKCRSILSVLNNSWYSQSICINFQQSWFGWSCHTITCTHYSRLSSSNVLKLYIIIVVTRVVSDEFIFTASFTFLNFFKFFSHRQHHQHPHNNQNSKTHITVYYITITVDSRVYKLETLPVAPSFIQSFVDMYQFFYPHYFWSNRLYY
jgi:hypothetical protein